MPTKPAPQTDDETLLRGRAIFVLRERLGLTQQQAADAMVPSITSQYWGMYETGRVPGIYKASVQRKIVDALNVASGRDPPLTMDDLADALAALAGDSPVASAASDRMARIARELQPAAARRPETLEAVFPTRDGLVAVRYPSTLSKDGARDLETYLKAFLATVQA